MSLLPKAASLPVAGTPEGLSYPRIIEIVSACTERMKRAGESHAMLAKWISEGINAAASPPAPEGKAEPVSEAAVIEEAAKIAEEGYLCRTCGHVGSIEHSPCSDWDIDAASKEQIAAAIRALSTPPGAPHE